MLSLYVLLLSLWLLGPLLTLWNIWNVAGSRKQTGSFEAAAFSIGIFLSLFLYNMWNPVPWYEKTHSTTLHEPFSEAHLLTLEVFLVVGLFSYAFLKSKLEKASPLAAVFSMAGINIGILVNLAVLIQLYGSVNARMPFQNLMFRDVLLMMLVPFNYLLLAVKILIQAEQRQIERWKGQRKKAGGEEETEGLEPLAEAYQHRFLNSCNQILAKSRSLVFYSLLLVLPLVCVTIVFLLFGGQGPDSLIRVFTETSDWTFSMKISPFPAK